MPVIVKSLHIYPLKAGCGLSVPEFQLTARGPEHDRLWMIVREPDSGDDVLTMVTQRDRDCEKLARVKSQIHQDGTLTLTAGELIYRADPGRVESRQRLVKIHSGQCFVHDAGQDAADFISAFMEDRMRLVRISDKIPRAASPKWYGEGHEVSLADGSPLLIASSSSLETLQAYFAPEADIEMTRFRPNIVLSGLQPFQEDILDLIQIGETVIRLIKPCERCKVTTVDQETGMIAGKEPLATLTKTRIGKSEDLRGVFFGQDAIPQTLGRIHVGQEVDILSTKQMHPALEQAVLKFTF